MIESPHPEPCEGPQESNAHCVYSFEWFLRRYVESRFPAGLRRYVGVSDIVQSIFCMVVPRMHQFRGSSEVEFRGWLIRIAERKILDGLRRYRNRSCPPRLRGQFPASGSDLIDDRTPRTQLRLAEEAKHLLGVIAILPPDIRAIVILRHVKGMTFEEISAELVMPVTTCRRRWLEGLQQIKSQVGELL